MPTHVRFRLNKITGEVEEFLVDDQDRNLPEAEHDRIAAEVARVISRRPLIHEVAGPVAEDTETLPDDAAEETDRDSDGPLTEGES